MSRSNIFQRRPGRRTFALPVTFTLRECISRVKVEPSHEMRAVNPVLNGQGVTAPIYKGQERMA